jgi:hypothetical protein
VGLPVAGRAVEIVAAFEKIFTTDAEIHAVTRHNAHPF